MKIHLLAALMLTVRVGVAADLSGNWTAQVTRFGEPQYVRVTLSSDGGKLTGTWGKSTIEGAITGNRVEFSIRQTDGRQSGTFTGEIGVEGLSGEGRMDQRAGGAGGRCNRFP